MICIFYHLIIFLVGYLLPIGLSFHGWNNKKYDMVEYYLKYIFFFVIFENMITPLVGTIIYKINSSVWCFLHLSIYIILITPKFNYLYLIYETVSKVTNQNNLTSLWNNYLVKPLNDKINKVIKKVKNI
ncbi:conserved Plasmodium protein, unknown function [Plasmodium gallinaceum]|uniref:Uncharacterized protein n=1 Tax=Plasmodium gallinaceum TaxID=5849 RepID=A0A1J1GUR7_PLAGA|nr:conserved Plasmodium protein, unknown function [Plasmodium gallinaceum]CRG96221.1 conserved Plasmodium protein, unknown function [Plasmodium gallinaceum]